MRLRNLGTRAPRYRCAMTVLPPLPISTPDAPGKSTWHPSGIIVLRAGVSELATEFGAFYLGGEISALDRPTRQWHHKSPAEVRAELPEGKSVIGFQNRNPIHKAHYELIARAPGQVTADPPTPSPPPAHFPARR
eukprot:COSAG05_NODE_12788_length_454_cov_1.445070_2_plen_134_part_01